MYFLVVVSALALSIVSGKEDTKEISSGSSRSTMAGLLYLKTKKDMQYASMLSLNLLYIKHWVVYSSATNNTSHQIKHTAVM